MDQEIRRVDGAQLLQQQIGWSSTKNFKSYISKQLFNNCNVTFNDINRADLIYSPARPLLEGKMTCKYPVGCKIKQVPLPIPIHHHHKDLELFVNFFT